MSQPRDDKREFRQEQSLHVSLDEAVAHAMATLQSARHPPVLISQDVELQDPSENRRLASKGTHRKPDTGRPFRLLVTLRPELLVIASLNANRLAKP